MDETASVDGRYTVNFIIGVMTEDQPGEVFLLTCEVTEIVNHCTL